MSNTQQSPDQIVYVPTPISEKPEKQGYYPTLGDEPLSYFMNDDNYYVEWSGWDAKITHWLKPTPLSSLLKDKQKRIEELEAERDEAKKDLLELVQAWREFKKLNNIQ